MADLLEFPTRELQAFRYLRDELGALLQSKGADDELVRFATETLTEVYAGLSQESDCQFDVRLPATISADEAQRLQQDIARGIDQIRQEHHDLTLKLAARLVLTELRLFQHERSS
jgi:hypothetical protein